MSFSVLDPETDIMDQFLDPETDIKRQFLVDHPETDIMDQFLDPETDIMGERTYIKNSTVFLQPRSYVTRILCQVGLNSTPVLCYRCLMYARS